MDYSRSLMNQPTKARIAAEETAALELTTWYRDERDKVEAKDLSPIERIEARQELLFEMGSRSSRALAKAKRDNSVKAFVLRELST